MAPQGPETQPATPGQPGQPRAAATNPLDRIDLSSSVGGHRVTRLRRRRPASSNNGAALVCDCGRKIQPHPPRPFGLILCGVCDEREGFWNSLEARQVDAAVMDTPAPEDLSGTPLERLTRALETDN